MFYNTVLAHGDGTIVNIRAPGQLTLGIFKNLECECVNVRINRGFYKKYIKIQVLMFMQHRMKMRFNFVFADILIFGLYLLLVLL